MKKKIYIAGPMTGYAGLNFAAFHAAAAELRALGHEVINPAEINSDLNAQWVDCMRADLVQLATCSAIHLLAGWEKSRGASLEHHVASQLGFTVTRADGAAPHSYSHQYCYERFCQLRDHRDSGAEAPKHTEAEAFALSTEPAGGKS